MITIDATCDDERDGCRGMVVAYRESPGIDRDGPIDPRRLIACDPNHISGSFDLSRFAGTSGWLDFYASDRWTDETLRELVSSVPINVGGAPSECGDDADAGVCATAPPPAPVVTAPLRGPVARPDVEIAASCSDAPGAPCRGTYVWYQRYIPSSGGLPRLTPRYQDFLACGSNAHAKTVDLSGFDETEGWLVFGAYNEFGKSPAISIPVAVDLSSSLCEVERVNGKILDADSQRILLLTPDLTTAQVFDRSTLQYTTLISAPLTSPDIGVPITSFRWAKLTRGGALLAVFSEGLEQLWEVDGRTQMLLTSDGDSYDVAGDFATWAEPSTRLVRRDLVADTEVVLTATGRSDVTGSGDVVFVDGDGQISRFHGGMTDQLTSDDFYKFPPITDGTYILYERRLSATAGPRTLVLFGPAGAEVLDSAADDYEGLLASGWIAFTRFGTRGVFIGRPHAVTRYFDFFAGLEGINAAGHVMLLKPRADLLPSRRSLVTTPPELFDVSSQLGTALTIDGVWHIALNGSLFRPGPNGDCTWQELTELDAGVADGGPQDGGDADAADAGGTEPPPDGAAPDLDAQLDDADLPDAAEPAPEDAQTDVEAEVDGAVVDGGKPPRPHHRHFACALTSPRAPTGMAHGAALSGAGLAFLLFSRVQRRRLKTGASQRGFAGQP